MGFKPGLTADNEPETLKAQAFSVGQSEYSGQVNDAVRSSATATEFLATDGNPVLQGGEDVIGRTKAPTGETLRWHWPGKFAWMPPCKAEPIA